MTEKKYIEQKTAFEMITDLAGSATTKAAYAAIWKAAKELNKIPAADVEEVVRCKDCKYFRTKPNYCSVLASDKINKDFYCESGERKDG